MDEQEIKEAAYALWERDGRPDGHDLEHWFKASAELGRDGSDSGKGLPLTPHLAEADGDSPGAAKSVSGADKRKRKNASAK